jgi:hemolysin activation/secretion protein
MVALRLGGAKVWGDYPWFDAAFIGGEESLRGWRSERFGGDAALYGGADLRLYLTQFQLITPNLLGVFGGVDAGRVWVDGQSPGGYHVSYGGGLWFGILGARHVVSVSYMRGEGTSSIHVGWGFPF